MGGKVRYYSVEEAARVLRLIPERAREMLEAGGGPETATERPQGERSRWRRMFGG